MANRQRGPTRDRRPPASRDVYIERGLVNPKGSDPGQEVMVFGNLATTSVTLAGWRLVDRNGNETPVDLDVGAGASAALALDGAGAQLGNGGGNLVLYDHHGAAVDSVSYSASDAAVEDRYVRFRR